MCNFSSKIPVTLMPDLAKKYFTLHQLYSLFEVEYQEKFHISNLANAIYLESLESEIYVYISLYNTQDCILGPFNDDTGKYECVYVFHVREEIIENNCIPTFHCYSECDYLPDTDLIFFRRDQILRCKEKIKNRLNKKTFLMSLINV